MSLVGEVGRTVQTSGQVTFEWRISDFFSLSYKVGDFYRSPVFRFCDLRWNLELYPNGHTRNSSSGWVDLYLTRKDSGPPKTVYYKFGIKGSDRVDESEEIKYEFSQSNYGFGYGRAKMWLRSDLRNRKSILQPNNGLTIICNLGSDTISANKNIALIKGEKKLGKSFLSVLESGDDSDVVIKVRGKEFPAHRVILRARSSVFRSMFTHDMLEKQSNVVKIEDCDPETFRDFLVHIYSGSCEQISAKNVYSLYRAADKYDVGELKEACAEFMKNNITVACFCDIATLAIKHNEKELLECATKYFCENSVNIVKTAKWPTFLVENVTVGNELFIKALSK